MMSIRQNIIILIAPVLIFCGQVIAQEENGNRWSVISPADLEFVVTASADPPYACYGDEIQLDVEVTGGLGSYAYTWTSDPPGFYSTLKDPSVIPLVSTSYIVKAADGVNVGFDTVHVEVNPNPIVSIGADTIICPGEEIILDAGPGHITYEWQDGSLEQTFTAFETGFYWVEVSNIYGCFTSDSMTLTILEPPLQPAKPAGPSFVDLSVTEMTEYVTSVLPDVLEYIWLINPSNAGEITNNGTHAFITWDTSFSGQVRVQVMANNICGGGQWSDSLSISVVNTSGTYELDKIIDLEIFPNPNKGTFTLSLHSTETHYFNIRISDPNGKMIYRSENILLNGYFAEKINLEKHTSGIYSIIINNHWGRISRKFIISE